MNITECTVRKKLQKDAHMGDGTVLNVRQVSKLQDITVPAGKAIMIGVAIEGSELQDGPLLLEDSHNLNGAGLGMQSSLFKLNEKGEATMTIFNVPYNANRSRWKTFAVA